MSGSRRRRAGTGLIRCSSVDLWKLYLDLDFFFNGVHVGVGNLPTEIIPSAALLEVLFQENRPARIAYKYPCGGKHNVT